MFVAQFAQVYNTVWEEKCKVEDGELDGDALGELDCELDGEELVCDQNVDVDGKLNGKELGSVVIGELDG